MLTATFIVYSFVQALLLLYIFKKGRPNFSYLLFFGLGVTTWCWVFLSYLSLIFINSENHIYIVRAIMFSAVIQIAFFYLFANKFPNGTWRKTDVEFLVTYGLFTLLAAATVLSPYMFRSVSVENGVIHMQTGPAVLVFVAFAGLSIILALRTLIKKFHTSAGIQRSQISLLLLAAVLNWVVVPMTNFALTLTLKTLVFVMLSPVFGLLFSGIIAYALIRHRLFDVRTVLRDSIIYIDYYLRKRRHNVVKYYELQTLVYRSTSNHVALDFSGVKDLDGESVAMLKVLRDYMEKQGRKIYFIGYTKKVFKRLKLAEHKT